MMRAWDRLEDDEDDDGDDGEDGEDGDDGDETKANDEDALKREYACLG